MLKKISFLIISSTLLAACNPPAPEVVKTEVVETAPVETTTEPTTPIQTQSPEYIAYSPEKYNELLGKKPFALFFHAPWCPTCRSMEKNITAELTTFPQGTTILKADFDSEKTLKAKYGITVQSTIVIIDSTGKAVKTLAAPDNEDLIEALNSVM